MTNKLDKCLVAYDLSVLNKLQTTKDLKKIKEDSVIKNSWMKIKIFQVQFMTSFNISFLVFREYKSEENILKLKVDYSMIIKSYKINFCNNFDIFILVLVSRNCRNEQWNTLDVCT